MMTSRPRLVVIGNGMAGARLMEDVIARSPDGFEIVIFGDEPRGNYNRILLSGVLAGTHRPDDILINPLEWYRRHGVTLHAGVRAQRLDLDSRVVIGASGLRESYDTLVLATGSQPLLPSIAGLVHDDGTLKDGAFVFRTVDDCERIAARIRESRTAIVIGGGLLGIEAARGLLNHGLDVRLVHLAKHLMDVQLDRDAGRILQRQLEAMGLRVLTARSTTAIVGNDRVRGILFNDGTTLDGDMVVVAAGIRPNVQLAKDAGLAVNRGIVVGDDLGCEGRADVFAIGECAEHRGRLYGLVAPLWEQARVLADRLTARRPDALYVGSGLTTKLKVAGLDVAVMGLKDAVADEDEIVSYTEPSRGVYKKLIVRGNRLAGAILMGDPAVVPGITQAFIDERPLTDQRAALLFPLPIVAPPPAPEQIPDDTRICDCNAVSKAQIVDAVLRGARSVQAVCDATRAATGCGSCRPEVQRIVELASRGFDAPNLLASPAALPAPTRDDNAQVVTFSKIEKLKQEKDGLDLLAETPALAQSGWQSISDSDRERLKWLGVFFRKQTPGKFMMRLRLSNGFATSTQVRVIAGISETFGTGSVDITTRQQIQIRGFDIEQLQEIWSRLDAVGVISLQTGMDNIRNVIGCAAAGVSKHELFDASPIVHQFTDMFLRNKEFTNLPRKFNVGITGCNEHCTHAESQDLALTPAVARIDGRDRNGFNVAIGGKMGSGGCRMATPLDIFVEPYRAAALCREIVLLFRDHGSRAQRTRARLAFLLDSWGVDRFRSEIERRWAGQLERAGHDTRTSRSADHLGVHAQAQPGLSYVGLLVPVGRIKATDLRDAARVADAYGSGELRFTTSQNIIVPNVPDAKLSALLADPLVEALQHDPPGAARGLVACTGIDYCHFALIETKELAVKTAAYLSTRFAHERRFTTHWSGCPAGCGNHAAADIGLLGKNIRVNGEIVEAVDVYVGGRAGPEARPGTRLLEDVPCDELPAVLERVVPYITGQKTARLRAVGRSSGVQPPPSDHSSATGHAIV
jgi:NAD(P)H-dependent nitrite reductase large subunit